MPDTAASLVIALSADLKQFRNEMRNATGVFDAEGRKIERRQAQLRKKLETGWGNFSGLNGMKGALAGLTVVGVAGGLAAVVEKGLKAAAAIKDMSLITGFGTTKLQELHYMGTQAALTFDEMDQGLTFFNKTFGEFINTGKGKLTAPFKQLGIDQMISSGQIRTVEQAFDAYISKVGAVGNASQRANLLAAGFGRFLGPKMAEFAEMGAAKLEELRSQAHKLGVVLSEDTVRGAKEANDKLKALFAIIEAQGVNAIAQLAPQIAKLAQQITNGLPDLVLWAEKWAEWFGLIRMSPVDKFKSEIADLQSDMKKLEASKGPEGPGTGWAGLKHAVFGTSNKDIDTLIAADKAGIEKRRAALAKLSNPVHAFHISTEAYSTPGMTASGHPFGAILPPPKLKINDPEAAAKAAAEAAKVKELIAQTGADAVTAEAAMAAASSSASIEMLKGTSEYYAAVKKEIDDKQAAEFAALDAEEDKKLRHLQTMTMSQKDYEQAVDNIEREYTAKRHAAADEGDKKRFDAGSGSVMQQARIDATTLIRQYGDEAAALGLVGGAAAKFAYIQGVLNAAREKGIELSGLEYMDLQAKGDEVAVAAELAEKQHRAVESADEFRQGLVDVGVAGVHGFKAAENALASMLERMAEARLEAQVLGPIVDSLFGAKGTPLSIGGGSGGGIVGSIFGSIFGSAGSSIFGSASGKDLTNVAASALDKIPAFASGTDSAPGGLAVVGEHGKELANLPKGTQVIPHAPSMAMLRGAGSQTIHMGDTSIVVQGRADDGVVDRMHAELDARDQRIIATVNAAFPKKLSDTMRDRG